MSDNDRTELWGRSSFTMIFLFQLCLLFSKGVIYPWLDLLYFICYQFWHQFSWMKILPRYLKWFTCFKSKSRESFVGISSLTMIMTFVFSTLIFMLCFLHIFAKLSIVCCRSFFDMVINVWSPAKLSSFVVHLLDMFLEMWYEFNDIISGAGLSGNSVVEFLLCNLTSLQMLTMYGVNGSEDADHFGRATHSWHTSIWVGKS